MSPVLSVQSVHKSFGGIRALTDVTFDVAPDHIMGVIGPNGAGKTTLFNVISGVYTPDGGTVEFAGKSTLGRAAHDLVSDGIARTFQNVALFESMSTLENVLVGGHVRTKSGMLGAVSRWRPFKREEQQARINAMEWLDFVGLSDVADLPCTELPLGWQRLLEIARALASNPKIMLLDEPAAGLNASETKSLGELIRKIRDRGITVLLVEHDMSLTMNVCDRIVVLDQGSRLAEGTPREIQQNPDVMAAYLGEDQ